MTSAAQASGFQVDRAGGRAGDCGVAAGLGRVCVLRRELRLIHNKTYGSIGAIIAFLVWLWITNIAILLGAELNAERERSRQLRDGVPEAERELQLEERSEPKPNKRFRTA